MTINEDAIFREMVREQERLGLTGGSRKIKAVEKRIRQRAGEGDPQEFVIERRRKGSNDEWLPFTVVSEKKGDLFLARMQKKDTMYEFRRQP